MHSNWCLIRRYWADCLTAKGKDDNHNPAAGCQPNSFPTFFPNRLDLNQKRVRVEDGIFGLSRTNSVPCQVRGVRLISLKQLGVVHTCNNIVSTPEPGSLVAFRQARHEDGSPHYPGLLAQRRESCIPILTSAVFCQRLLILGTLLPVTMNFSPKS